MAGEDATESVETPGGPSLRDDPGEVRACDQVQGNIAHIRARFPHCVTKAQDVLGDGCGAAGGGFQPVTKERVCGDG